MPTIDQLKAKYFVQAADATPPSEPVPALFADCRITPLIDCAAYNAEIDAALGQVGTGGSQSANANHFVFIANWWLGLQGGQYEGVSSILSSIGPAVSTMASEQYSLDPPANTKILAQILKQKAQAGVDVRLLGWVSFAVIDSNIAMKSGAGHIARVNAMTMESIKDLRTEPLLARKCVLNVIAHTAGAVHNKMVVIGNDTTAVGFTGGLDFEMGRFAHPDHPGRERWHDVVAKVEGPAVQELYDHFKNMWNENVSRPVRRFRYEDAEMPSFVPGTTPVGARGLVLPATGTRHHVQTLRTVPQFNYHWYNCLPENIPITFGPQGIFEYRIALRKALRAAESYIYIEDQAFWSQEILSWVRDAVQASAALRVILLFPGGADPNDPASDDTPKLTQSINHGLLDGLTAAQRGQIRLFRRFGHPATIVDSGGVPLVVDVLSVSPDVAGRSLVTLGLASNRDLAPDIVAGERLRLDPAAAVGTHFNIVGNPAVAVGDPIVFRVQHDGATVPTPGPHGLSAARLGVVVHSKTFIVDDNWALIGSGNCMRRSLYTDVEHGVAVIDEDGAAVRDYRASLWAGHFEHAPAADFNDIDNALNAWEPSWGTAGPVAVRPNWLESIPIPVLERPFTDAQRSRYDNYEDLDSRQDWGGILP